VNLRKYQEAVVRGNFVADDDEILFEQSPRFIHSVLGLCAEAGEVANLLKRAMQPGSEPLNTKKVLDELGDTLWFLTSAAGLLGYGIEELASLNYQKLNERHPSHYPDVVE